MKKKRKFCCPYCGKNVESGTPDLPFCSERCRLMDLGRWLDGSYSIAGRKANESEQEKRE